MKEYFLQYIWFNKLFYSKQYTTDGQNMEIIDTGQLNTDAGADVFNAKVKIGDKIESTRLNPVTDRSRMPSSA